MKTDITFYLSTLLEAYVGFTLIFFFWKRNENKVLMMVLSFTAANVILTKIFLNYNIDINLITNIHIIVCHTLWLVLLAKITHMGSIKYFIIIWLLLSIVNFFFVENPFHLNSKTFISSAMLYVVVYIFACIKRLSDERLDYFFNNNFILISSPILYLIGYSMMFGFKSKTLNNATFFNCIKLFDLICYFANYIFYTLITVYIYKEEKYKKWKI